MHSRHADAAVLSDLRDVKQCTDCHKPHTFGLDELGKGGEDALAQEFGRDADFLQIRIVDA